MGQPGVDGCGPLLQIERRKMRVIDPFERSQNIAHFFLGMAGNPAIRLDSIQASPKLHPHGLGLVKNIF